MTDDTIYGSHLYPVELTLTEGDIDIEDLVNENRTITMVGTFVLAGDTYRAEIEMQGQEGESLSVWLDDVEQDENTFVMRYEDLIRDWLVNAIHDAYAGVQKALDAWKLTNFGTTTHEEW